MQGDGSQANPYIPENWADFVTACETSGAYVSVPQGTVYEFNEIAPAGFSGRICETDRVTVYGNGLIINNLRYTGDCFLAEWGRNTNSYYYDINFTNMYFTSGVFAGSSDGGGQWGEQCFYHCRFSGEFYGNSVFSYNRNANFLTRNGKGCSFNLKFAENSRFFRYGSYASVTIRNGNVKLNGETTNINDSGIYAYDSQFTGKMPFSSVAFSTADRCIFDMDIENISKSSGTSVLNSDRLTGTQSGFLTADSQQIRNAEYLRNIGFPIGVD